MRRTHNRDPLRLAFLSRTSALPGLPCLLAALLRREVARDRAFSQATGEIA